MKKIFTLAALLVLAIAVNAQGYRKWDFTNWSATTVENLQNAATAGGVTGGTWSDIEKKDGTTPGGGVCFWSYGNNIDDEGNLAVGDAVIAETEGLVWNTAYTSRRSLAIAVNYPSTSLGEYGGPQYLWLGGGNAKSASARIWCFKIPYVRIGQKITITAESHKPSDSRGVSLFVGDCTDDANQIGESFTPKTLESYTWEEGWTLPEGYVAEGETVDIIVYNTNGCHLYSIEVGDNTQKSRVAFLYNGTLSEDRAYTQLSTDERFTVEAVEATGAFTMETLTAYDAIVISSTLTNADAIASLKAIQPFVPTLNLNPAIYATWGYGAIGTNEQQFAQLVNTNHALFRNLNIIESEGISALQICNYESFKGVTLADYFANDEVLATVMDSEDVAIHAHNLSHNGYLFVPYTQEALADAATPQLLNNAIYVLVNSKAKVTAAAKPTIKLDYKNLNTDVTITSTAPMAQIFYTLDGSEPTEQSQLYTEPFNVSTEGVTVKAVAKGDGYLLSEVAEAEVTLKQQLEKPTIAVEKEDGQSKVTITYVMDGTPYTIYYNYTGDTDVAKSSPVTEEPIIVTKPMTIYAFVVADGYVNSELASAYVDVQNAKVRLDIVKHMDANSADYNNGSTSTAYYFSWGKNKSGANGHPYYNPDVFTEEEPTIDPETGDEIPGKKIYTELNTEEEVDFQTGWALRSRGQIVNWENLESGTKYGDNSGYNFATIEDNDPDFPATKGLINLADKNTEPADATFPYNAYIVSTEKFKGPFDVIAYVGSIVKPENEAKHQFVIQTSVDGNAWDSAWETLGDSILIQNKQRLTTKVVRSYEGADEVYVRLYLANFNSKIGIYDIYIANAGEKTQEFLTGIEEIAAAPAVSAQPTEIYNINGVRLNALHRGLNIVRKSDGTTRKVMVK